MSHGFFGDPCLGVMQRKNKSIRRKIGELHRFAVADIIQSFAMLLIFPFFYFADTFCDSTLNKLKPSRVAQSVGHLTRKSGVLGSIPSLATYFRFSFRFFMKGSSQLLAKVCARSTG